MARFGNQIEIFPLMLNQVLVFVFLFIYRISSAPTGLNDLYLPHRARTLSLFVEYYCCVICGTIFRHANFRCRKCGLFNVFLFLNVDGHVFLFFCNCYFAVQTQTRKREADWPGPTELFFQAGEKNELFSSKQAFSWPFVCFDLGIRRLHECLYCHVMCTQCVNYWK